MRGLSLSTVAIVAVPAATNWLMPGSDLASFLVFCGSIGVLVVSFMLGITNLRWYFGAAASLLIAYAFGSINCPVDYFHWTGFLMFMSALCYFWPIWSAAHAEAVSEYINELDRAGYFDRPAQRSGGWSFSITLQRNRR